MDFFWHGHCLEVEQTKIMMMFLDGRFFDIVFLVVVVAAAVEYSMLQQF